MKTLIETNTHNNGKLVAGILIATLGGLLLINQFSPLFIPDWLFSWPMWLIGWGLYIGGKHNFRNNSWLVSVLLGVAFLCTQNIYHADVVVWPIVIMTWGLCMIYRNNHNQIHV